MAQILSLNFKWQFVIFLQINTLLQYWKDWFTIVKKPKQKSWNYLKAFDKTQINNKLKDILRTWMKIKIVM